MQADYYRILGVSPTADPATIKVAYRRRAMVCHPDRGGSHTEMLLLNEAWAILSDRSARKNYDAARAQQSSDTLRRMAEADIARAREKAGEYPRRWPDFEALLDGIRSDLVDAEWRTQRIAGIAMQMPHDSVSGWLFMAIGVGVALYATSGLPRTRPGGTLHPRLLMFIVAYGALGGALAHMLLGWLVSLATEGRSKQKRTVGSIDSVQTRIVPCPKCGRTLRVHNPAAGQVVRCPGCHHQWAP